jgi:hypothetical protein
MFVERLFKAILGGTPASAATQEIDGGIGSGSAALQRRV